MYIEKYQATGNDFILFKEEVLNPSEVAIKVCHRRFGVGADGILFPSSSVVADIKMNYYNSDGSIAKMCGNGIRAFAKFVYNHQLVSKPVFKIETLSGVKDIVIDSDMIKVNIGEPKLIFSEDELTQSYDSHHVYHFNILDGYILSVGTLHAIIYDVTEDLKKEAKCIQNDPIFVDGANINFVKVIHRNHLFVETFERGSGWTLSCGTGVSASVYHAMMLGLVDQGEVFVDVKGGKLVVEVKDNQIYLTGPAEKILEGNFI